jgi:hypothetical protein
MYASYMSLFSEIDKGSGIPFYIQLSEQIRLLVHEGNRKEARELAERAIVISRETGIKFIGPIVLGLGAEVETDPATRLAFLDEGEAVLQQGCASHNYFYFCNSAIVVALSMRDWDRVLRYAAILEDYTRPEPLPWSDFFIARGRALAAHGRGRRDEALTAELERLRDKAAQVGFKMALTALEKALTKAKQDGHAAS